jgi:hypothetical protein
MSRLLPLLIALAVPGFVRAEEPDAIRAELDKAKKTFSDTSSKAKAALLAAFDDAIKTVAAAGDLDGVKAIQSERKVFDETGKTPISAKLGTAVGEYTRITKQAKAALDKAYDSAVKDYTKALKIEKAEGVRKEWKDPRPNPKAHANDPEEVGVLAPSPTPKLILERNALAKRLAGTLWTWGDNGTDRVSFNADGTVLNRSNKLTGTWAATTGNRVVITWDGDQSNFDLLIFDATYTSMNATFIGTAIEKNGHAGKLIRR